MEAQMLRLATIVAVGLLAPAVASAQSPNTTANPISRSIKSQWSTAKKNLIESADQMPESNFAFKPVDTVRSFGAILAHVAGANYVFCSAALGEKSPHGEDEFEKSATTKDAIVKALRESVAYCDKAYDALTDQSAAAMVEMPFGMPSSPRATALMANTGHVQEHYGNLVTYFRIKGMVPPSSRGQ
jgi:uncharacterized damage-inducible protein DinB